MEIAAHHQRTIERLTEHFKDDPAFPAMIIGGSVAKGRAQPNSDVDITLVVADDEYRRRKVKGETLFFSRDFTDYEGGYVDGKIVSLEFLRDAAERGSEPTRAAFAYMSVAYSRIPELADVLKRIPVYQEHEQHEKIEAFFTQMVVSNWYMSEAEKRNNRYLLLHSASDLVLYGGRLILAHNKILYPYHKWFMWELERAPAKPANLMTLIDTLLAQPSQQAAQAFYDAVHDFREWGLTEQQAFAHNTEDVEWIWRTGRPALEDW